ncbi:MAG TPA: AI-2E family transporter [Candidatus Nanoarchaeia archaeon]|nr:AI-2E family transporter [Candidatus Nanoarchaeia archaeon]
MNKIFLGRGFLIALVVASLVACYFVFRPFLADILMAAILATIFYRPFQWLAKKLGGREKIAALIMCLLILVVIIVPLVNLIILAARESVAAYGQALDLFTKTDWSALIRNTPLAKIRGLNLSNASIQNFFLDFIQKSSSWLMSGAAGFIKGTTNFIVSLLFIVIALFFFFIDGEKMLERLMNLTPLPNKYDRAIFKKFKDVGFTFILSTFVVAIIQALVCALGFFIITLPFFFNVPLPVFFAALAAAFFSLIPVLGAWLIWLPGAVYLLLTGHLWAALFLALWGLLIIIPIDSFARPLIINGKAEVHPIFLFFSILGGIILFGFWGIVIGPLIVAVTVTIFHIYELEYKNILEK